MDSFIAVTGWSQHVAPQPNRPFGHFRSLSSVANPSASRPARAPGKSPSTSHIPDFSFPLKSASPSLRPAAPSPVQPSDEDLSTLPDPRSRAMSPELDGASSHHPDLNDEVATLSTKLINAINHQTSLDDTLAATRQELELSRERIRELEEQNASQREMLAGDVWVRRKTVEEEKKTLLARLADEKKERLGVEQEKKRIEQELENLTTALFEEANKMVVSAKEEAQQEQELLQKKNDQLRGQLVDMESLLTSQQEQLAQLKTVMEQMSADHDDHASGTAPSSPGIANFEPNDDDDATAADGAPSGAPPHTEPLSPTHPTGLTHLIQPILRTDLASYDDFIGLSRLSRRRAGSRVSSGSSAIPGLGGFGGLGLALGGSTSSAHPSNASTASPGMATTPGAASSPQTPNSPASVASTGGAAVGNAAGGNTAPLPALKDTKFFKRVLSEDIEPTLRLDTAPGLSWLARRSVVSAMTDGTIVVEPVPTNSSSPYAAMTKPQLYPCSLCGEQRKDEEHLRMHRFRINETDSAQRHPLCSYCLGRVRSTCEFLNFLRILKDGHWRTNGEDAEKAAWEESVRLREQMFWSRIGGGVVPAGLATAHDGGKSPRTSTDETALPDEAQISTEKPDSAVETETPAKQPQEQRHSAQSLEVKDVDSGSDKDGTKRLSITIPASSA